MVDYGLDTGYTSRQTMKIGQIGKWYNQPSDTNGCCSFNKIATEFQCQGLELDSVLLAWGSDMRWENTRWKTPRETSRNKAKDTHQLRINSYRVLLTRARDGIVILCPRDSTMEVTNHIIRQGGFEEQKNNI